MEVWRKGGNEAGKRGTERVIEYFTSENLLPGILNFLRGRG